VRRVKAGLLGILVGAISVLGSDAAAAQDRDSAPRTTFVLARYGTRSSRALYAGYGTATWQGILAVIENPRTEYREALVGLARALTLPSGQGVTLAVAMADASDALYTQVYIVPTLSWGSLALSGTGEIYAPLQRRGAFQYYLNPLSMHVSSGSRLQFGTSYVMAGQTQQPLSQALGPSVKTAVPHAAVTLDWLVGLAAYRSEVRLTFQSAM
jgi:hypothetical protein